MKTIHSKTTFRTDLRYARQLIVAIERAVKNGEWDSITEDALELEGLFGSIRSRATDNREGIEDFDCKYPDEIREIRAQQEAERKKAEQKELAAWQKAAEKEAHEFEKALGIKITVVTEGLEDRQPQTIADQFADFDCFSEKGTK